MKNKSIIGALAILLSLTVVTSCEDMLDIDSSRVVYEDKHDLGSNADSVYSTLGLLHSLQQIADRYVLLGEVRGDLVSTNEITNTALRAIADFNIDTEADNKYLAIKDYYAIINNCNYILTRMDTTLTNGNDRTMIDEYAAALSIRAWTYLQIAINYGKARYFTKPITKIADAEAVEKECPEYEVKELATVLAAELRPYEEYDMPVWGGLPTAAKNLIPEIPLVLTDLYLWAEDYESAIEVIVPYLTESSPSSYQMSINNNSYVIKNLQRTIGNLYKNPTGNGVASSSWSNYVNSETTSETRNAIPMYISSEYGTVSEVHKLFFSKDGTHQLVPSEAWKNLSNSQTLCMATYKNVSELEPSIIKLHEDNMDGRSAYYYNSDYMYVVNSVEHTAMRKFNFISNGDKGVTDYTTKDITYINIYRTAIVHLRAAEAMINYAKETGDKELAVIAYDLLRDGYAAFKAMGQKFNLAEVNLMFDLIPFEAEVMTKLSSVSGLQGVHARGCGDTYLDSTYSLKPFAIVEYLSKKPVEVTQWEAKPETDLTFNDTIQYIEQRIIDELALESAFEGNRFGDLIRFAKRHQNNEFLAHRIANREGVENATLKAFLMDESNWYLPIK